METVVLNSLWHLEAVNRDEAARCCAGLSQARLDFTLPNDIHSILLDHHLIDDPYKGQNAQRSRFINALDWKMETLFSFHPKAGEVSTLVLSSVDTFATVILNGKTVAHTSNSFARYLIDVTNELVDGENRLEIVFSSLDREISKLQEADPTLAPQALVRKPARHFGPYSITPVGIYEPVKIVTDSLSVVKNWNCTPHLVDHNWIMKAEVCARVFRECDVDFNISIAGRSEHTTVHLVPSNENYSHTFTIPQEDVVPWNPAGMGGQHLYPMEIGFGGYSDRRMIAFRTVRLDNSEDEEGRRFTLYVNDRKVFVKGITWSGLDILPSRTSPTRCIHALQSASQVGINAVRVHSSSAYESEIFYDSCDRLGLMVWQDMMLDEARYPRSREFAQSLEEEIEYQVLRLKSHPSIVVFSAGGNPDLPLMDSQSAIDYDRINNGIVERTVRRLAPLAVYVPHSGIETVESTARQHESRSYGLSYFKDNSSISQMTRHRGTVPRFSTSISFPSLPSPGTVRNYCEEGEMNIATDSMMKSHSSIGAFELIVSAILARYRFPDSLEKMIYLSQLSQAEIIASIVDYYRSRSNLCSGLFIKSLESIYPAADESAIEYSGKWKMLMYQLRYLFAPITTICIRKEGKITVLAQNDTNEETEVKVSLKFSSFAGDKLKMQVFRKILPPQSMVPVCSTDYSFIKDTRNAFAYIKVSTPSIYREDLMLLDEPKRCHFMDPELKVEVKESGKGFLCTVSCIHPAFQVWLDSDSIAGSFSENLFSVRPTAQKTVTFTPEEKVTLEEFASRLKTRDLYWASN